MIHALKCFSYGKTKFLYGGIPILLSHRDWMSSTYQILQNS